MLIIDPQQPYTYSQYFELRIDPIDLCEYFGYSLTLAELLPRATSAEPLDVAPLQQRLTNISTSLISRNEQAKREMLVAPVIELVVAMADALIRIEYPINVPEQLQGTVDYLVSIDNLSQLLVIEAKRDDMDYGFTQLMAELIALDRWERSPSVEQQPVLCRATTSFDWSRDNWSILAICTARSHVQADHSGDQCMAIAGRFGTGGANSSPSAQG